MPVPFGWAVGESQYVRRHQETITKSLTEIRGIEYRLLEGEDVAEMAQRLADVFSRYDPLAVAVGISQAEIEGLVRLFGSKALSEGPTVVARAGSGELVGAMLSEDFATPQPLGIEVVAPRFAPIGAILKSLDNQYRRTHAIIPGSHIHLFMVGVSASFAGAGIAQTMINLSLENATERGYRVAVTEATGRVSQSKFRKLGFRDLHTSSYQQFLYQGRPVFASIEGHEGIILMEMAIDREGGAC